MKPDKPKYWIVNGEFDEKNGWFQVEVLARIRENETGEIRFWSSTFPLKPGDPHPDTYIWEDGNYSCDCNRALFFHEIGGKPCPDVSCSEGRFSVNLFNPVTMICFYREFEEGEI